MALSNTAQLPKGWIGNYDRTNNAITLKDTEKMQCLDENFNEQEKKIRSSNRTLTIIYASRKNMHTKYALSKYSLVGYLAKGFFLI